MRNLLLAVGFFGLFGVVVVTYPSYAENDLVVVAVVAGLLISGLVGILASGKGPGSDDSEAP